MKENRDKNDDNKILSEEAKGFVEKQGYTKCEENLGQNLSKT